MKPRFAAAALAIGIAASAMITAQEQRPTFRAGTSRVSLNVVVRDNHGRPITNLAPKDFQVLDQGRAVSFDNLGAGEGSVSIAVLVDTSGSMALGSRLASTTQAVMMLLDQFGGEDEAALFTFDSRLREVVPFTCDRADVREGLARLKPFGSTSLHDAVAAAARQLADRPTPRRAVVAITDGFDNSSELTAAAASGVASSSDVPVYVLAISQMNRPLEKGEMALEPMEGGRAARLDELTARTGGASFAAEAPGETYIAIRHILGDLRAGYLLGFTPTETPGWHDLTVRVARKDARVRTRAGFWVQTAFK